MPSTLDKTLSSISSFSQLSSGFLLQVSHLSNAYQRHKTMNNKRTCLIVPLALTLTLCDICKKMKGGMKMNFLFFTFSPHFFRHSRHFSFCGFDKFWQWPSNKSHIWGERKWQSNKCHILEKTMSRTCWQNFPNERVVRLKSEEWRRKSSCRWHWTKQIRIRRLGTRQWGTVYQTVVF